MTIRSFLAIAAAIVTISLTACGDSVPRVDYDLKAQEAITATAKASKLEGQVIALNQRLTKAEEVNREYAADNAVLKRNLDAMTSRKDAEKSAKWRARNEVVGAQKVAAAAVKAAKTAPKPVAEKKK